MKKGTRKKILEKKEKEIKKRNFKVKKIIKMGQRK
jgi:hypothetical protein